MRNPSSRRSPSTFPNCQHSTRSRTTSPGCDRRSIPRQARDIALRGVGMAIFARAYLYRRDYDVDFDTMAARLGTIDWHLLTCERDELPKGHDLRWAVQKAALPMWAHLLAVSDAGYRVRSSSEDADGAWSKIQAGLLERRRGRRVKDLGGAD